jgi:hypothetical protein
MITTQKQKEMKTKEIITTNIFSLYSSAYMGHTVQNKDGKKLHWTKLKEMENKQVRVILGGDYYNRIFTLID